jgi:cytochrome c
VKLVTLTFATGLAVAGAAQAEDPQALLQKYNCTICHANDEAKAGPALVDVAAAYRGKPQAVSTIAAIVRKGVHGSGPWPMPPSPQVPAADARKIAQYILALRK